MSLNTDFGNRRYVPTSQREFLPPNSILAHPSEVVNNPRLTQDEKRALLASWLSDARAVPNAPAWRQLDSGAFVRFDEVSEARRSPDGPAKDDSERAPRSSRSCALPRRRRSSRWIGGFIRHRRRDD